MSKKQQKNLSKLLESEIMEDYNEKKYLLVTPGLIARVSMEPEANSVYGPFTSSLVHDNTMYLKNDVNPNSIFYKILKFKKDYINYHAGDIDVTKLPPYVILERKYNYYEDVVTKLKIAPFDNKKIDSPVFFDEKKMKRVEYYSYDEVLKHYMKMSEEQKLYYGDFFRYFYKRGLKAVKNHLIELEIEKENQKIIKK